MTRRSGARSTYGSVTMDKKKRSLSRQAVRALSARPPSGRGGQYVSYADIPQTREDEEWAADRAQSPSAAGAKLRWDASMQELRSRTDLTRPRSPSRQASRSVTRSVSRRSGEGDDEDGGDDDPDVMEAAASIARSVSVTRPLSAPVVMAAALPAGRARRIEAAEGLEATTTAAGVLETREESIRRSMSQQLSPSASPTLEEELRAPDPAYHEQLVKGSPTDFAKREAGYETAWSGSRSMPPALGSLSRSGSLSHSMPALERGSVSQQAHQSSRTSRFRGAVRGTRRSLTRDPEDVEDIRKRSASRVDEPQEYRSRSYSTRHDPVDTTWRARMSFPRGMKREAGIQGFVPVRKNIRTQGPALSPYRAQKPRALSPHMQNAPIRRDMSPELSPKFGRVTSRGSTYEDEPRSKRPRRRAVESLWNARITGRDHPDRRQSRSIGGRVFDKTKIERIERELSSAKRLEPEVPTQQISPTPSPPPPTFAQSTSPSGSELSLTEVLRRSPTPPKQPKQPKATGKRPPPCCTKTVPASSSPWNHRQKPRRRHFLNRAESVRGSNSTG